jgi:hypothetical protein
MSLISVERAFVQIGSDIPIFKTLDLEMCEWQ